MFFENTYKKYLKIIKKDKIFNKIVSVIEYNYHLTLHEQQKVAAMALIMGNIIDMKTGEGKTFSGLLAACYMAIKKRKVHIISSNDYLSKRDYDSSKKVFSHFNITSEYITSSCSFEKKKTAYKSDVVYATAQTFVFDYLREIHTYNEGALLGIEQDFVIIDEADSVLIDQALSPFSNSQDDQGDNRVFLFFNDIADNFVVDSDFTIDPLTNKIKLEESGYLKLEDIFIKNEILKDSKHLYLNSNISNIALLINSLKAKHTLKKDKDYSLIDNEVIIIDPVTGRLLTKNQRWSNGLHQAVEAKEGIQPKNSQKTTSSISFQNFFKKYKLISAMSGTAISDADEYNDVYGLNIINVPTFSKSKRIYNSDLVFINKNYKKNYLFNEIILKNTKKRPILIATTSVSESEELSSFLYEKNIEHNLINAKNKSEEADLISKAGLLGQITVCTNMAGRGTDITLGFDLSSKQHINDIGGLLIIGYGRSYEKRVDEQLTGRCARQGDNGEVQFLLSFDDELADKLPKKHYQKLFKLMSEDESSGLRNANLSNSFSIIQDKKHISDLENRKNMIIYDDIVQEQRDVFYYFRKKIFDMNDINDVFNFIKNNFINDYFSDFIKEIENNEKAIDILKNNIKNTFFIDIPIEKIKYKKVFDKSHLKELNDVFSKAFTAKFNYIENSSKNIINLNFCDYMKINLFANLDNIWFEYNQNLETLKNNIKLRSTANIKPIDEFTEESFFLFEQFLNKIYFKLMYVLLDNNHFKNFNNILEKQQKGKEVDAS